mmetsp:Transcript_3848/g.5723  ORF Transcript_3848/g.5723 Transcript_3848/m.5723 type:complete len:213 (-) Transcript_3848:1407-2045(-)
MKMSKASTTIFITSVALGVVTTSALRSGYLSSCAFSRCYHRSSTLPLSAGSSSVKAPVMGDEEIMKKKQHGTSEKPVQQDLRWGCDFDTADRICNFNRHYAEHSGYWKTKKEFVQNLQENMKTETPIDYYDSVTGKLLFTAPKGRTYDEFVKETMSHGWPSFRDEEVNWEEVRVLKDGETVSVTGTHLGHNLPDGKGNRYCINLVSVAGKSL